MSDKKKVALTNDSDRTLLIAAATIYAGRLQQFPHGRGSSEMLVKAFQEALELQRLIVYGVPKEPPKEKAKPSLGPLPGDLLEPGDPLLA